MSAIGNVSTNAFDISCSLLLKRRQPKPFCYDSQQIEFNYVGCAVASLKRYCLEKISRESDDRRHKKSSTEFVNSPQTRGPLEACRAVMDLFQAMH